MPIPDLRCSVITATLDPGPALLETIESVAAQTHPVFEHLIQDGGSNDGSLAAARAAHADRISIVTESDRGISDAFNRGIARCRGEIVGILNAGDRYHPRAVERALRVFAAHPEVGFTFGDMCFGREEPIHIKGDPRYWRSIRRRMPFLNHPTVFVRRAVYRAHGGFAERWKLAMDYELLLRFHLAGVRGAYIPYVQAFMAEAGVSDKRWVRALLEVMRINEADGRPPTLTRPTFGFYLARQGLRRGLSVLLGGGLGNRLRARVQRMR